MKAIKVIVKEIEAILDHFQVYQRIYKTARLILISI